MSFSNASRLGEAFPSSTYMAPATRFILNLAEWKTAFWNPLWKFWIHLMPFGLINVPTSFQHMISNISGYSWIISSWYICMTSGTHHTCPPHPPQVPHAQALNQTREIWVWLHLSGIPPLCDPSLWYYHGGRLQWSKRGKLWSMSRMSNPSWVSHLSAFHPKKCRTHTIIDSTYPQEPVFSLDFGCCLWLSRKP